MNAKIVCCRKHWLLMRKHHHVVTWKSVHCYNFSGRTSQIVGKQENVDGVVITGVVEIHFEGMIWIDVPQDHVHGSIQHLGNRYLTSMILFLQWDTCNMGHGWGNGKCIHLVETLERKAQVGEQAVYGTVVLTHQASSSYLELSNLPLEWLNVYKCTLCSILKTFTQLLFVEG
jgi:hypothetical protein